MNDAKRNIQTGQTGDKFNKFPNLIEFLDVEMLKYGMANIRRGEHKISNINLVYGEQSGNTECIVHKTSSRHTSDCRR